jgi:signal transduction histidine kinase
MRSLSHELRTSLNAVNGYISEAYEKIDNILQVEKNLKLSLKYVSLM